ncbi:MAG: hypothetical protein IPL84_12260 [Chitinophagaceae bacterium]|nr:hypothetical protein [Chitinophagaceae bacterium]
MPTSAWLTIGSYNINNLSAYASIELNVNAHNLVSHWGLTVFDSISKHDCVSITEEAHAHSKETYSNNLYDGTL